MNDNLSSDKYLLAGLLDSCETMLAVVDSYFRVVYANRAMKNLMGTSADGSEMFQLSMLFTPDDGRAFEKAVRLVHAPEGTDGSCALEARLLAEYGGAWVGVRVHPVSWGGSPGEFAAVEMTGISDHKALSEKLSHVALEWTATFDAMSDAVALIDQDNNLTRVNFSMAGLFGVHPKQMIGRKCYEVVHNRDEPWPGCPHMECMKTGKPASAEVCDPNLGLPLYVTCSPLRDRKGNLVGTIHIARDISVMKKEQEEREELIAKLQQAMSQVRLLTGLLPICANCKKIRDEKGSWQQMEAYISGHSSAMFSHGICPDCARLLYPEFVGKNGL